MLTYACLVILVASLFFLLYIYFGYPILLTIIAITKPSKAIIKSNIRPSVTLVISCYNEENIIRKKLENTLQLRYPPDNLEIVVISDGSTDETDKIVSEFAPAGVRLIRQEGRLGKTSGLNLAMSKIKSEFVIFSDANAMYHADAVIHLLENFSDPKVGYVVGEARYTDINSSSASASENTYWQYEIILKKLESKVHSVVGGDGAIYAIRRSLYEPLKRTDINDFVNPLQIVAKGYRGVYEPAAVCWEETAGNFQNEFKRKARIVNRSFSGVLRVPTVLNPFKSGFYSLQLFSHKILRWFAGIFIIFFFASSMCLSFLGLPLFQIISLCTLLMLECAYIGYLFRDSRQSASLFFYPYYYALVNIAALYGIVQSFMGSVQVTWEHHRGEHSNSIKTNRLNLFIHCLAAILFLCFLFVLQSFFRNDIFL